MGKPGTHHCNQIIKVNITNNDAYWCQVPPDVIDWEGYNSEHPSDLLFLCLFISRGEGQGQRGRERESQAGSTPSEIMTWANIKNQILKWLRHPDTPDILATVTLLEFRHDENSVKHQLWDTVHRLGRLKGKGMATESWIRSWTSKEHLWNSCEIWKKSL